MPLQEHEIPTVVIVSDDKPGFKGIATNAIFNTTSSGVEEVFTDFSLYDISFSSVVDSIMEFIIEDVNASFKDTQIEIFRKELTSLDKNTLVTMLIALKNLNYNDIDTELYFNSYLQNVVEDTEVTFRINLGKVPEEYDTTVEMYIWGTKLFNTKVEAFCAAEPYYPTLDTSVEQASGKIVKLPSDIYTTVSGLHSLDTYICNTVSGIRNLEVDLNNRPGRINNIGADVFSTRLGLEGNIPAEFKVRSLFTGDFFLERDKFTTASAIAWVDMVDYLYPINTDNTYLEVNGVTASGTWFEDIPNGKRLYYNPLDDFYSDGVLTYTLHTESSIGEVEEKDFYLLYGYNIEPGLVVDWGPNNRVVVRLEAQNLAFCPNKEGEAFDFVTSDLRSMNLKCTINPVGYVDLPVSISPQSKTFYYGKTYTIKVKGIKDYAGNIMPDFEYTFTIEDPNA